VPSHSCLPGDAAPLLDRKTGCTLQPAAVVCTRARLEGSDTCPGRPPDIWFNGGRGALIRYALWLSPSCSWRSSPLTCDPAIAVFSATAIDGDVA